jgi:hypothetical protein
MMTELPQPEGSWALFLDYPTRFYDSPKWTPASLLETDRVRIIRRFQVDAPYIE